MKIVIEMDGPNEAAKVGATLRTLLDSMTGAGQRVTQTIDGHLGKLVEEKLAAVAQAESDAKEADRRLADEHAAQVAKNAGMTRRERKLARQAEHGQSQAETEIIPIRAANVEMAKTLDKLDTKKVEPLDALAQRVYEKKGAAALVAALKLAGAERVKELMADGVDISRVNVFRFECGKALA